MNPRRAQKQQQQQERDVVQGTVPCLGTFLTQFLMVDSAMEEYLEGRMTNFDKRRKEYQMVAELQQLQAGCCYDALVPNEQFRAWFGAVEQLSERDSFHLSCELEPPPQSASENFKAKHIPEGIKPWSQDRQAPYAVSGGSSTSHSSVQLQRGPVLSSGDAADSPPRHVASSAGSEEEIHLVHVPEPPDGQETKVGQSTSVSPQDSSIVTSASRGMSSSSSSIRPRSTRTSHKHRDSRPLHKRHVDGCCSIRVSLDEDDGHSHKSILVTDQDRAPAVIRKALEEHSLGEDKPEDYQLVQIISEDRMLQIPDSANVYYAMVPVATYHILLLKSATPLDAKIKDRALSALLGSRRKGPSFWKRKF